MTSHTPELTDDEHRRAIHEGERNAAADEYFKARAWILDTTDNRRLFEAGFDRAAAVLDKLRQGGEPVGEAFRHGEGRDENGPRVGIRMFPAAADLPHGIQVYAAPLASAPVAKPWPAEEQPDGAVTPVDPVDMASAPVAGEAQLPWHFPVQHWTDEEKAKLPATPQASADARSQWMEEAAAAIEDHQREGRQWVPGSLWDTLSREAAARIRALKFTAAPQPAEAHDLEDGAHDRDNYFAAHADEQDAAERYRWLRDLDWYAEPRIDEEDGTMWKVTFYTPARIEDPTDDDSLDTAIDAARAAVLADRQQRAALASKEKNDAE